MSQKVDKKGDRSGRVGREEEEEDYGDYTTRCICGYVHDDGFMVQCDGCSVWQHVECITVNPNNLPDKYLCEVCHPRPVDKKRARQLQQKKRDDISAGKSVDKLSLPISLPLPLIPPDVDDMSPRDNRSDHRKPLPHPLGNKRRRKQSKDGESKPPSAETKKTKKEKVEGRK
ncbi:Inactive histone-lysine N-methyltransferase 2E, partial [Geodia barretti]